MTGTWVPFCNWPAGSVAAMDDGGAAAIEVCDLTVRYGDLTAVDGLSFTAAPGAITALLGPNGAGKTTTVAALEGFHRPDSGTVRILGLDPIAQRADLLPRIGAMLQQPGVHTGLRPLEALELYAAFYDDPADPRALLEEVGLADRVGTSFRRLSGGEQQRLSLALALVGKPEVAFLDEPTAGVDVEGRRLIRRRISQLRDEGVAVLLTTHDLDDVERLADHVVIIDAGRVVAAGTPAELMSGTDHDELRFGAPAGLPTADLTTLLGVEVVEDQPGEYVARSVGTPVMIAALASWLAERDLALADLRAGRQRLEDVFVRLTGERTVAAPDPSATRGRRRRRR